MLDTIRRHSRSWIAKGLLYFIVLTFAIWGIGDYFSGRKVQVVATVGDDQISDAEYEQALDRAMSYYRNLFRGSFTPKMAEQFGIKQKVLDDVIERHLVTQEANRLRLLVTPDEIRSEIMTTSAFANEQGQFDQTRYTAVLHGARLTPTSYEGQVGQDIQRAILTGAMTVPIFVEEMVEAAYRFENEQRKALYYTLNANDFRTKVSPDQETLKKWFDEHQDRFMTQEQATYTALVLDPALLETQVEVSDDEARTYYDNHASEFQKGEERRTRHILIKADPNDQAAQDQARATLEQVKADIEAGKITFEDAAKKYGQDTTSNQGGDLGWVFVGQMVPPFEEATYALEPGKVSDIVSTRFGLHLIRVDEIHPARTQDFVEVKGQILVNERHRKALDKVFDLATAVEDAIAQGNSLSDAAVSVGLATVQVGPVGRNDVASPPQQSRDVLNRIFTLQANETTHQGIEVGGESFVFAHLDQKIAPQPKPFDEVADKVKQAVIDEQAGQLAKATADRLVEALRAGKDWRQAMASIEIKGQPTASPPFKRNGTIEGDGDIPDQIVSPLFEAKQGDVLDPIDDMNDWVVAQLAEVIAPSTDGLTESVRDDLVKGLEQGLTEEHHKAWIASLRSRIGVSIDEAALATINPR